MQRTYCNNSYLQRQEQIFILSVPEGITYTIAIEGVLDLMEIPGYYVQITNRGRYSVKQAKVTRLVQANYAFENFEVVSTYCQSS